MKLYNSFEDKNNNFTDYKQICTISELDSFIDELNNLQNQRKLHCVFRGVNNAKYMLFNSAQRQWQNWNLSSINNISYIDRINNMLSICQKSLLAQYYKSLGIQLNDWLLLSFLQHYGSLSPCLDFSKEYKAALFFACNDVAPGSTDNDLDNYVSIYYFKLVDAGQSIKSLKNIVATINRKQLDDDAKQRELSFDAIMRNEEAIFMSSDKKTMKLGKGKRSMALSIANLRSTSQTGEFVCNRSEDRPLEDLFKTNGIDLFCTDIHKGLCDYIIKKCLGNSIELSRKKYFPKEIDISTAATANFMLGKE